MNKTIPKLQIIFIASEWISQVHTVKEKDKKDWKDRPLLILRTIVDPFLTHYIAGQLLIMGVMS